MKQLTCVVAMMAVLGASGCAQDGSFDSNKAMAVGMGVAQLPGAGVGAAVGSFVGAGVGARVSVGAGDGILPSKYPPPQSQHITSEEKSSSLYQVGQYEGMVSQVRP